MPEHGQRGGATVETAVVVPLVLVLMVATIGLISIGFASSKATMLAGAAARAASRGESEAVIRAYVHEHEHEAVLALHEEGGLICASVALPGVRVLGIVLPHISSQLCTVAAERWMQ